MQPNNNLMCVFIYSLQNRKISWNSMFFPATYMIGRDIDINQLLFKSIFVSSKCKLTNGPRLSG
jgi:hypothetical protein